MYEKVFQLDSRPFVSTPDVERFYSARAIHHALSKACSSIDRSSGTVLVIGPTGCGKTLFLNMLEDQFKSVYRVVNIACARLVERQDLLQNILFELNQPYLDRSEGELRLALIDFLKPDSECPNGILLLVDEAHLLTPALLDEIRLLTNLVRNGQPRAQLVLAGNMKLEENLMDSNLESFNQRVASRCYLSNFSKTETLGYVQAAIARAGAAENQIFTETATEAVFEVSEGCPRLINQVCDHAMILAASANVNTIDAACIHEAWADVQQLPNSWAEVATQAANTPVECSPVEFGSLGEDSDFDSSQEPSVEEVTTEDFSPRDVVDANADTTEVTVDLDSNWSEIEFGSLDDDETEQLNSLPSFDNASSDAGEVIYEFEPSNEIAAQPNNTAFDSVEDTVAEEYQLAPAEPLPENVSTLNQFTISSEFDSGNEGADDFVDVRFKDLAQFLAQGKNETPETTQEEVVAPDEQMEIVNELKQAQIEGSVEAVLETESEDLDESLLDAQLNELMSVDSSGIKVFQVEEEVEASTQPQVVQQTLQDPFAEAFEHEERVHDPYTAMVVKQNTSSLSISRVELAILEEGFEVESAESEYELIEPASQFDERDSMQADSQIGETTNELGEAQRDLEADITADVSGGEILPEVEADLIDLVTAESTSIDEKGLLDTIQQQQAEIADQIFQLKKDLASTGVVEVEGLANRTNQGFAGSDGEDEPVEIAAKIETPLESVNDDDRDILVITRVSPDDRKSSMDVVEGAADETQVSKGRAIRMEYNQLFKQLRAAE